jgi:hypothetical protein
LHLDSNKIQRYFTFITSIRVRNRDEREEDYYINIPMVNCKSEWFKDVKKTPLNMDQRFCPNLDRIRELPKEYWQLEGAYDNRIRTSFATLVEVCTDKDQFGNDCKPREEIKWFQENVYITEYMATKRAVLLKTSTGNGILE